MDNFIDIDNVISPRGRQRFVLPYKDMTHNRPEWTDTVRIGDSYWSEADLDMVDCENIDLHGSGIKYYNGTYYYSFTAAKRIADRLHGWHIPTIGEWAYAREHSMLPRMHDFVMPSDSSICDNAMRIRRLAERLAILPLGQYDSILSSSAFHRPFEFGTMAYYWTGDCHIIVFSSSLSVMGMDLNDQDPDRFYTPIRLVMDSKK